MEGLFEGLLQPIFEFVFEMIGELVSRIFERYLNGLASKISLPFEISFFDELTKLELFK